MTGLFVTGVVAGELKLDAAPEEVVLALVDAPELRAELALPAAALAPVAGAACPAALLEDWVVFEDGALVPESAYQNEKMLKTMSIIQAIVRFTLDLLTW